MTVFLVIVGLSGSLLAFYTELDRALNPDLYPPVRPELVRMEMAALAEHVENTNPGLAIARVYFRDPERVEVFVTAKAGQPPPAFDTLLLDPYSGGELARHRWGDVMQGRIGIMPFIYTLHYELALGTFGLWTLGIVALAWTLDCFVGLYLTLPSHRRKHTDGMPPRSFWQRWAVAWRIKKNAGAYRIVYDLHRAGGLWLWGVLLVFAWSSVYMNLWDTLYTWTTRAVLDFRPAWVQVAGRAPLRNDEETLGWRKAQAIALNLENEQTAAHGLHAIEAVSLRFQRETATYSYLFRSNRDIQDRRGRTEIIFDARTGQLVTFLSPSGQYAGNTVTQWLYALHEANVFGLPYRIFVSILGLLITLLSVTGVYIWWKKQTARQHATQRCLDSKSRRWRDGNVNDQHPN